MYPGKKKLTAIHFCLQGWPKLANNVLLKKKGGGFALGLIAPVKAIVGDVTMEVSLFVPMRPISLPQP